jgi:hypothetical protein
MRGLVANVPRPKSCKKRQLATLGNACRVSGLRIEPRARKSVALRLPTAEMPRYRPLSHGPSTGAFGQQQTISVAAKFALTRPVGLAPFGREVRAKWSGPTDYRNPVFQFFAVTDYQDAALRMSDVPISMISAPRLRGPFAFSQISGPRPASP